MNQATAEKINGALCHVWMAIRVWGKVPEIKHIRTVADVSLAQIESAVEVIEAINRDNPKQVICTVDREAIPSLKNICDSAKKVEGMPDIDE